MVSVGILANAESGRDVRRLVTGATVSDNAEKAAAIARLIAGASVEGVDHVLVMPTSGSVLVPLERHLRQVRRTSPVSLPDIEIVDYQPRLDETDTVRAAVAMVSGGCSAIAVLGGDGTHRLAASVCGSVPMLALSTGTNNAFPARHEETSAGRALGLVAAGRISAAAACRQEYAFSVSGPGWEEMALVDVALVRQRFIGSKAVWRVGDIKEVFVTFGDPAAIGLSSIAAAFGAAERGSGIGARVQLAQPGELGVDVIVALAPGHLAAVRVREVQEIHLNERIYLDRESSSVAIDGERTVESSVPGPVTLELVRGPLTIDPRRCLSAHSELVHGLRRAELTHV